jgi:hypothetical protein
MLKKHSNARHQVYDMLKIKNLVSISLKMVSENDDNFSDDRLADLEKKIEKNSEQPSENQTSFAFARPFGFTPPAQNKPDFKNAMRQNIEAAKGPLGMGKPKMSNEEVNALFTLPPEPNKLGVRCRIGEQKQLMDRAKDALTDQRIERGSIHLVDQYRTGNKNPGIGTTNLPGTVLTKLRDRNGTRVHFYVEEVNEKEQLVVVALSCKDEQNENAVISLLQVCYASESSKNGPLEF